MDMQGKQMDNEAKAQENAIKLEMEKIKLQVAQINLETKKIESGMSIKDKQDKRDEDESKRKDEVVKGIVGQMNKRKGK